MARNDVVTRRGNASVDETFPEHFNNGKLRVFTNPCGEVFVQNTESRVTMRINAVRHDIEFTTEGCFVEPVRVTNTIGHRVSRRR